MTLVRSAIARFTKWGPCSTFTYAFGRFRAVRIARRWLRQRSDHVPISEPQEDPVLDLPADATHQLQSTGIASGLTLSPVVLKRLLELETQASVSSWGSIKPPLEGWEAIQQHNQNSTKPIVMMTPSSLELNAVIRSIAHSPRLLGLVRNHLGGGINAIEPALRWSLVVDADDAWRESQAQTVTFHFDVHDLDFVYVFFYLTPCDRDSGAHETILGSHADKPLKFLLGSARQTEPALRTYYAKDAFHILEGPAGYGFIEDTSSFHRARVPVSSPRLVLSIRYS